jgi:hypothetical protein
MARTVTQRIRYTPRAYQHPATEHIMATPRCALWADMGMGKGVATLTALDALNLMGDDVFPVLALGPLRVARDVWPVETGKWEHLAEYDVSPIIGAEQHRLAAIHRDRPIYAMNYEHLPWLEKHWGENWPYRTVIADESTKLKNYRGSIQTSKTGTQFVRGGGGQRARALAKVAHTKVKRFIELTGTPAPNGLKNLWAQMWFLDAGRRLGRTYTAFTQRWFRTGYNGYDLEPLPHANAEIHALIADLCLTLDPKDWFPNLKEPIVNTVYVELPPKAWKHYREMEKDMFTQIAGKDITAAIAAARSQKCLQMANGAVYITPEDGSRATEYEIVHSAKLEALESIVEEANGEPMLVAYEFHPDKHRLMKLLPEAVDISTQKGMAAFKAGGVAVGLSHAASVGHGVDGLQNVTNTITFFGHNWDLELYDQIIGRIGPMRQLQSGYDRPVHINHIVARGTVDEDVIERRVSKRDVQDILKDAMKRRGA